MHRSFVAGNPSRQQLIATLARATGPRRRTGSLHIRGHGTWPRTSREQRARNSTMGSGNTSVLTMLRSQTRRRDGPEHCPHQPPQDIAAADRTAGRDRTSTASASSRHCRQGQDVAARQDVDGIAHRAHPRSPTAGGGTIGTPRPRVATRARTTRRNTTSMASRSSHLRGHGRQDVERQEHRLRRARCHGQDEAVRPDLAGGVLVTPETTLNV